MIQKLKYIFLYAMFYYYHIRIHIGSKIMMWLDKHTDKMMTRGFDIINELEKMEKGLD